MIHKKCIECRRIGHKPEMVPDMVADGWWMHEDCYSKVYNVKKIKDFSGKWVWVKNV